MKKVLLVIALIAVLVLIAKSYSPASGDVKMMIDKVIDVAAYSHTTDDFHGGASFYADKYEGRATSSGEIFYQHLMTAAHKTLPLGTWVKVTNLKNGKIVEVKINDRGPFRPGRIIDLTKSAAQKIDMIKDGVVDVKLELLKK